MHMGGDRGDEIDQSIPRSIGRMLCPARTRTRPPELEYHFLTRKGIVSLFSYTKKGHNLDRILPAVWGCAAGKFRFFYLKALRCGERRCIGGALVIPRIEVVRGTDAQAGVPPEREV